MTKDSIDWASVPTRFRYMARDQSGLVFLFGARPILDEGRGMFQAMSGIIEMISGGYAGYCRGSCEWHESLVERGYA